MSKVLDNWREQRVAIVNGIALPDDSVRSVRAYDLPRQLPIRLDIQGNGALVSGDTEWTSVSPLAQAIDPTGRYAAVAGECGHGSDGFVALIDRQTQRPEWIAFFDFSNPFETAEITDTHVVARNNLGETWSIPRSATGSIDVAERSP